MGLHSAHTQTRTHTQRRLERDGYLPECVFMNAFLSVWEDQSTQEWVVGWRCFYLQHGAACVCVRACVCTGRRLVAFFKEQTI